MMEVLQSLKDTPLPTILVIGGMVFLFIPFVSKIQAKETEFEPKNQFLAGIIGVLLLGSGIWLSAIPVETSPSTFVAEPSQPRVSTENNSTSSEPESSQSTNPSASSNNSVSTTESRSDVLKRYDSIYHQNDWCTLWDVLVDDNLVRGTCPDAVTQAITTNTIVGENGDAVYGVQIKISSDIQVIYPACVTFGEDFATYEGGKVVDWVSNDFIATNITLKKNSFFTLFFRCEETISP